MSLHKLFSKTFQILHFHFHFNKKRTKIIYTEISANSLLAKLVVIYTVLVCKMFCPKILSCNFFFYKFHVCAWPNITGKLCSIFLINFGSGPPWTLAEVEY